MKEKLQFTQFIFIMAVSYGIAHLVYTSLMSLYTEIKERRKK